VIYVTETEISVNGKILIRLTETNTEKFETETDKFGRVRFRFRCISVLRHVTWYRSTNSLWSKSLQCTNKTARNAYHYQTLDRALVVTLLPKHSVIMNTQFNCIWNKMLVV